MNNVISQQIDLVNVINTYTSLRRQPDGSYRGRCPIHDGESDTSLSISDVDGTWLWHCFGGCGGGDAINWMEAYYGVDFKHACEMLHLDLADRPQRQAHNKPVAVPQICNPPSLQWQEAATALVDTCEGLLAGKPLEWLYRRGFNDDTIQSTRLGYNPESRYLPLTWFGLESYTNDKGKKIEKLWFPRGIVIPWLIDDQLWRVSVRQPVNNPKYLNIIGGSNPLYNADTITPDKPVFLCEGVFDALAIQQEAGDLVSAVAMGVSGGRSDTWACRLAVASKSFLCFDADEAGSKAQEYWKSIFPKAITWKSLLKDPAEMLQNGVSIRQWIFRALSRDMAEAQKTQPRVDKSYIVISFGMQKGVPMTYINYWPLGTTLHSCATDIDTEPIIDDLVCRSDIAQPETLHDMECIACIDTHLPNAYPAHCDNLDWHEARLAVLAIENPALKLQQAHRVASALRKLQTPDRSVRVIEVDCDEDDLEAWLAAHLEAV